ncbi:hypothetical protein EIP91_009753 [Steccherinum ochraceum]|uniref:Uncharacterized protein n=1 Tax=Steccherinum ochraceum TaxID=92696 RepID=A0A4R0R3J3_9APHY|nr:hypothetical protein EIP91_009753 [Steccherinum ochraceum]
MMFCFGGTERSKFWKDERAGTTLALSGSTSSAFTVQFKFPTLKIPRIVAAANRQSKTNRIDRTPSTFQVVGEDSLSLPPSRGSAGGFYVTSTCAIPHRCIAF